MVGWEYTQVWLLGVEITFANRWQGCVLRLQYLNFPSLVTSTPVTSQHIEEVRWRYHCGSCQPPGTASQDLSRLRCYAWWKADSLVLYHSPCDLVAVHLQDITQLSWALFRWPVNRLSCNCHAKIQASASLPMTPTPHVLLALMKVCSSWEIFLRSW